MLKEERVIEFVESVIEENNNVPIIVEGKRDELALRKLGLKGKIIRLNSGNSLIEFCESIGKNYKKVILFLDWDEKGNQLSNSLEKILTSNGVECEITQRKNLYSLVGKSIRSVEELYSLYIFSLEKLGFQNAKSIPKRIKR